MSNQPFFSPGYARALRRQRIGACCLLALGILGFICYALFIRHNPDLSDRAPSYYLGVSGGITTVAVYSLARIKYLLAHPEIRKKVEIEEQDERLKTIDLRACQFAGRFTLVAGLIAGYFLVLAEETAVMVAVMGYMSIVYFLAMMAAGAFFDRRL